MPFPSATKYQTAMQHPEIALRDSELQKCKVELTRLGIPKPRTGGFAVTFELSNGASRYAVRCFHQEVKEIQSQYNAISKYLQQHPSDIFTTFEYQHQGIVVDGRSYPIVRMNWVGGTTLGTYVEKNLGNPQKLRHLLKNFRATVTTLERMGVAHGDIQHGNVMVTTSEGVQLIDYDGMFVPGMAHGLSHEIGHSNFQHPKRKSVHFGPSMDRFSAAVVVTALELLIAEPGLWSEFNNGENLLFTKADFESPTTSRLFARATKVRKACVLAERLQKLVLMRLEQVPTLIEFLGEGNERDAAVNRPSVNVSEYRPIFSNTLPEGRRSISSPYPKVSADNLDGLMSREGLEVEVDGRVVRKWEPFLNSQRRRQSYIDFGTGHNGFFRIVVWQDGLEYLEKLPIWDKLVPGAVVSVVGRIEVYRNQPRIAFHKASDASRLTLFDVARRTPSTSPTIYGKQANKEILAGLDLAAQRSNKATTLSHSAHGSAKQTVAINQTGNASILAGLDNLQLQKTSPPANRPSTITAPSNVTASRTKAAANITTSNVHLGLSAPLHNPVPATASTKVTPVLPTTTTITPPKKRDTKVNAALEMMLPFFSLFSLAINTLAVIGLVCAFSIIGVFGGLVASNILSLLWDGKKNLYIWCVLCVFAFIGFSVVVVPNPALAKFSNDHVPIFAFFSTPLVVLAWIFTFLGVVICHGRGKNIREKFWQVGLTSTLLPTFAFPISGVVWSFVMMVNQKTSSPWGEAAVVAGGVAAFLVPMILRGAIPKLLKSS